MHRQRSEQGSSFNTQKAWAIILYAFCAQNNAREGYYLCGKLNLRRVGLKVLWQDWWGWSWNQREHCLLLQEETKLAMK